MKAVDERKRGKLLRFGGSLVVAPSRQDIFIAAHDLCLFQSAWCGGIGGQAE